jgi:CBS domain-containing protein
MGEKVEGRDIQEIAAFLARFPPFTELEPGELASVAAATEVARYPAGHDVLIEDAEPASSFYVIREGSMELVHEEEVIDILEPGEGFGHPSLLTGMAPAFTVRAHEESVCYLIPREQALDVLGRPAGAGFVASTLRERLTRTGHAVHALPELGTVRVGELIGREPVICEPTATIREAARVMTEANTSAALVRMGERCFILTDAQLRANVVAGGESPDDPVSRVAVEAVEVDSGRLAIDAIVDMLDRDVDHLVVVDARRNVLGIVGAADLLGLESRSPFALRHAVLAAQNEDELVEAAARLRKLFLALLDAGLSAADVGRVLSLQVDTFTTRLIDFAIWGHGPAPVPWAWLDLGSAARREFTLGSDQDNALAYADSDDAGAVDAYFERLAREVNAGLARCGFGPDNNEVLASNRLWRMSASDWLRVFEGVYESPDRSHLIRATVAFDFRHVGGGLEIVPPLVAVLREAKNHPDFIRRLARTATDFRPPLGFRGSLVLERNGEGSGRLDIKRGGLIPVVNLARFFALSNGITISPTLDRLVAAEEVGAVEAETAAALREAFVVFAGVRLQHHAAQIEAGQTPDNMIDPDELPPLTRRELREAFRVIAQTQKRLNVYVPLGL